MNKKFIIILVISLLALCLSVFSFMISLKTSDKVRENETNMGQVVEGTETSEDIQYVLYLGTNDKDSNEPVFDEEESKEKLKEILLDHFGGYTIQEANGGWKDGDTVYNEYTLVIYLSDTNIDEVHKACDEMLDVFHQSSVLIQSNKTTTEFYSAE
ncbi:MAG: DUF3574 domain-containing protein [Eubacterium sp.]|nr:DUF3574 domain-containing protein [Eubacterium sp.]